MNTGSNGFGPKAENTNPNQHSARYDKPPTGDFVLTGDSVSELSHALADLEASSLRLAQLTRTWQVRLSQASGQAPTAPSAPQTTGTEFASVPKAVPKSAPERTPQAPPHVAPQGAPQHNPQPPPTQADWRNQPAPLPQSGATAQPMFGFPSAHQWRRDSKSPQSSPLPQSSPRATVFPNQLGPAAEAAGGTA